MMTFRLHRPAVATFAAVVALAAASILPVAAQDAAPDAKNAAQRPINSIIELFTSQGCSSCPPADALLETYVEADGVLALSLPVDYWDYIGWKDTLASPKNTERQRAYVRGFGQGPVYTPQAVVNGMTDALGSDKTAIDRALQKSSKLLADRRVPVSFSRQNASVIIHTGSAPEGSSLEKATIWLVVLKKSVPVEIKRGENRGRTVTYSNVVRSMTPVGVWDGKPGSLQLTMAALMDPDNEDSVVLLQEGANGTGAIVGAAWLNR
jgi:hypothetical protein